MRNWVIGSGFDCFYDAPGDGGGGGDGSNLGGGVTPAPTAEPSFIELDDDALIKPKGSEKPIKFKEYGRSFQAQATKAAQERARIEKELARERGLRERYEAERRLAEQQRGQGGQQNDLLSQLEQLPYLDGKYAKQVVEAIGHEIKQRDQILVTAVKELQRLRSIVSGLHSTHTNQSFDAKVTKWLTDGGYPLEAKELAKDIYLAYEGDDLDQDFPRIFSERWEQIQQIIETQRQSKLNAARKQPFIPGRGGNVKPSKPLEIKPDIGRKELTDLLFNMAQEGPGT